MGMWGREVQRYGVVERGSHGGTGGPTCTGGGFGGMSGEQAVPAPGQTAQPRVPVPQEDKSP